MKSKLSIGTRGSQLALWQAEHIKNVLMHHYQGLEVDLKIIKTTGDKILDVPLAKIGGKGLFTKEIEEAMIRDEIDLAVHSLKDVPVEFPEGLCLSAITKREDPRDCFISHAYESLEFMPEGSVLGTTSLRRGMQIRARRPDIKVKSLRGNVQTRLKKLEERQYDAILLAAAGVRRLGIEDCAQFVNPIPVTQSIPAMGQAALGIETKENSDVRQMVQILNDQQAIMETTIERDFVGALDGGCQVPIGIYADASGEAIKIHALVGLPDGTEMLRDTVEVPKQDYTTAGITLAESFIQKGARELLKRAEEMAFK